jgi:hypothetical protein
MIKFAIISIDLVIIEYELFHRDNLFHLKFPIKDILEFILTKKNTDIDESFWDEISQRFSDDEINRFNLESVEIMFHYLIDAVYSVVRSTMGLQDIDFQFITWSGNDLFIEVYRNEQNKVHHTGCAIDLYRR